MRPVDPRIKTVHAYDLNCDGVIFVFCWTYQGLVKMADDMHTLAPAKMPSAQRRHSITVVPTTCIGSNTVCELKPLTSNRPKRRQSIQESLQHITKSMSSSLQKAMNIGGSNTSLSSHDGGKSRLTKNFFKEILIAHYNQPDLKVTKFSLRHVPNPHTNQVLHEVELWIKDAKGRRRLDLMVKYPIHTIGNSGQRTPSETTIDASQLMEKPANGWVLDGTNNEMEHEARIYAQPVQDMWSYLYETKGIASPDQFLCLPRRYKNVEPEGMSDLAESDDRLLSSSDILVLQDLFAAGYHSASQERMDECGLDFNHSIMTISRLARFHAVSYAMQGDLGQRMNDQYPFLNEDPVYRNDTKEIFTKTQTSIATRLYSIFQHSSQDLKGFSNFFMDAVRNLHSIQCDMVNPCQEDSQFHVLCHGDLWRQNVLFYYGTSLECQTDCVDVRFEDLHRARYASLVTDILYFLFTTVDFEIRRDHTMDFLAVYYDHFVKSVAKLSPSLSVFTREELFIEFKSKMMYGFLEGICLFSTVYESQIRKLEDEEREHPNLDEGSISGLRPRYSDYKDAVVSMVGDVIRVRFQGEAPPKSAISSSSPSHPSSGQSSRKTSANGNGHGHD